MHHSPPPFDAQLIERLVAGDGPPVLEDVLDSLLVVLHHLEGAGLVLFSVRGVLLLVLCSGSLRFVSLLCPKKA